MISVSDLNGVGTTVDVECCAKDIVTANDDEPAEQTAGVSVTQKGRKAGKKSATAGRKGNRCLFIGL